MAMVASDSNALMKAWLFCDGRLLQRLPYSMNSEFQIISVVWKMANRFPRLRDAGSGMGREKEKWQQNIRCFSSAQPRASCWDKEDEKMMEDGCRASRWPASLSWHLRSMCPVNIWITMKTKWY